MDRYSDLLSDLSRYNKEMDDVSSQNHSKVAALRKDYRHDTAQFHPVLTLLERYYRNAESVEESYDDINIPV